MTPLLTLIGALLVGAANAAPVTAFDLTLDLPSTAQPAGDSPSTKLWTDPGDGTVWAVERRGDGTGGALPVALTEAATMVPNAFGALSVQAPTLVKVAGLDAARVGFTLADRDATGWVFLSGGYLYGVTVLVPRGGALAAHADHLARTLKAPANTGGIVAPLTLAELGLELPGAADLRAATIAGAVPAVAMLDAPARMGLILARLPAATSAFTGKDATGVGRVLSAEGCKDVASGGATFAGKPAVRATCRRADGKGEENVERIWIVTSGDAVYVIRAVTALSRAAGLEAWAERRLGGAQIVR